MNTVLFFAACIASKRVAALAPASDDGKLATTAGVDGVTIASSTQRGHIYQPGASRGSPLPEPEAHAHRATQDHGTRSPCDDTTALVERLVDARLEPLLARLAVLEQSEAMWRGATKKIEVRTD